MCTQSSFRVAAAALGLVLSHSALSATLFADSFESYAVGTNLIAQGGWVSDFSGSSTPIGVGTYLSSKVLNGRGAATGQQSIFGHAVPALGADLISILSYKAYATSDSPVSHNDALMLTDSPLSVITVAAGWTSYFFGGGKRWTFTIGANSFAVSGGYDTPVQMSVVVNGITNEIYGTYNFGGGSLETPHYATTDALISSLDSIYVEIDRRGTGGVEIDEIILATVPEPETVTTWLLGLILIGYVGSRAAKPADPPSGEG